MTTRTAWFISGGRKRRSYCRHEYGPSGRSLTARLWAGPDPIRLVIDTTLRLPPTLQLFDGEAKTIVFNRLKHQMGENAPGDHMAAGPASETNNLLYYQIAEDSSLVHQLVLALYQLNILSVMIEGGAALLQSFIDEGYWDEARIITNEELLIPEGLPAPILRGAQACSHEQLFSDRIATYLNPARRS